MEFDRFTVCVLLRRSDAPVLGGEEANALQDAHLAHLARLHEEGHLLAAGPFLEDPIPSVRGLSIFRGSPEEVRRHADADPLVRAGYLENQLHLWMVPKGAVRFFPGKFPRSSREAEGGPGGPGSP